MSQGCGGGVSRVDFDRTSRGLVERLLRMRWRSDFVPRGMLEVVVRVRCQGPLAMGRREAALVPLSPDVTVADQVAERILLASYIEAAPEK